MMENKTNTQFSGTQRADTVLQRAWNRWEDYTTQKGKAMVARHYLPLGGR